MVKLIVCVKRKAGMGVEEFHSYWRTKHAQLCKQTPVFRQYVRKYVQSHTIPIAYERNESTYDGAVELWFDNVEALDEFLAHPEYLSVLRKDEQTFASHPDRVWFLVEEEHVFP